MSVLSLAGPSGVVSVINRSERFMVLQLERAVADLRGQPCQWTSLVFGAG